MPLPETNSDWPPKPFDKVYPILDEWSAWYSGDPAALVDQYGWGNTLASRYQLYGGIVGWVARLFWGAPRTKGAENTSKLHLPLAEDIAAEGGKQLFKNPPRISVESTEHQDYLELFTADGLFLNLMQAGEIGSGLGDVYLRVGYDLAISDLPIVTKHSPDLVIPFFSYGRLQSALLWRELEDDAGVIFRHMELHEPGWIYHRLYQGTKNNVGKIIALSSRIETRGLSETQSTGLDELAVIHIPNLHTRLWRKLGQASHLGRSDFGAPGIITLMDALDETYTSLMRDIRLGKFRLMVPQQYLDPLGRGQGASFDLDKEVFVELNAMVPKDKLEIVPAQAAIRVTDHVNAGLALTERIISGSGYSAQTFGMTGEVAMTATESRARERKTFDTRDVKIETWKPRTGDLTRIMFKTMVLMGKASIYDGPILVEFPLPVEKEEKEVAETIEILSRAQAISTFEKIRLRKPEWDEERINAEVTAIQNSVVTS